MATSIWRVKARRVIYAYIDAEQPKTADELRAGVSPLYPFDERKHHPYKIWLDEVQRAAERLEPTPTPDDVKNFWINTPLKKGG